MKAFVLLGTFVFFVQSMILPKPWTVQEPCDAIVNPKWPFAYAKKIPGTENWTKVEAKGRVTSNLQMFGPNCTLFGVQVKCHRCEKIVTDNFTQEIYFQIQGMISGTKNLPLNVPTITDIPWAITGRHRYDFEGSSHVCMLTSPKECFHPPVTRFYQQFNYSMCKTKCFGYSEDDDIKINLSLPQGKFVRNDTIILESKKPNWSKFDHSDFLAKFAGHGSISIIAGLPKTFGSEDGKLGSGTLKFPTDAAIDFNGNIYIVDSGNHCIRQVSASTLYLTTVAGICGKFGFRDGFGSSALFNNPYGIELYYDDELQHLGLHAVITDSHNHRLRLLSIKEDQVSNMSAKVIVSTLSGRLGQSIKAGYLDGNAVDSLFNHPQGISCDPQIKASFIVTDTNNHLLRRVFLNGDSFTIAGTLETLKTDCHFPCLRPSSGTVDGSLKESRFHFPIDLSVDSAGIIYVTEGHKIRVVDVKENLVKTFSLQDDDSRVLHDPTGILVSADGNDVFITERSGCKVKRFTRPSQKALSLDCNVLLDEIIISEECDIFAEFKLQDEYKESKTRSFMFRERSGKEKRFCFSGSTTNTSLSNIGQSLGHDDGTVSEFVLSVENQLGKDLALVTCLEYCVSNLKRFKSVCHQAQLAGINTKKTFLVFRTHTGDSSDYQFKQYAEAKWIAETLMGKSWLHPEKTKTCGYEERGLSVMPAIIRLQSPSAIVSNRFRKDSTVIIVDTGNHLLRAFSNVCSYPCQNGGRCKTFTCVCAPGWDGVDCIRPICDEIKLRHVCTGPNHLSCIPGYTGVECKIALCHQRCEPNGVCSAPDVCTCHEGWFGVDCKAPVCSQTCGNGGNCTGNDACTCPTTWTGKDCRTPVCQKPCLNGGSCVAPDTCFCTETYSGQDCSLPICSQGFFKAKEPNDYYFQYMPCALSTWCNKTDHFHCQQNAMKLLYKQFNLRGDTEKKYLHRNTYGFEKSFDVNKFLKLGETFCLWIELNTNVSSPFAQLNGRNLTKHMLVQEKTKYFPVKSFKVVADRRLSRVQLRKVPIGEFQCANSGTCISPNECLCQHGWIGFDCRTPVCTQGFFKPNDNAGNVLLNGLEAESPYVQPTPELFLAQGLYQCSTRAVTEWESPLHMFDHPNFFSRYVDKNKGWPQTYRRVAGLGNYTTEGWKRDGFWKKILSDDNLHPTLWRKGECEVAYERKCTTEKANEFFQQYGQNYTIYDTNASFHAFVQHDNHKASWRARWLEHFGECIDVVHRGCYNNGTCVGPNVCSCAKGFTGFDCSIPTCTQACSRSQTDLGSRTSNGFTIFKQGTGNCTMPNICTCEKGWTGHDCSTPICAQECNNYGSCVLPDTCLCKRWKSSFIDGRANGGWPFFRNEEGDAQLTGWTGYDCSTPICTQSASFHAIQRGLGNVRLSGYGLILFGQEPYNNILRSDISTPPYLPYFLTQEVPPRRSYHLGLREHNNKIWRDLGAKILEHSYRLCRKVGTSSCLANPNQSPFAGEWGIGDGEIVRNDGRSFQSGCKLSSQRFSDHFTTPDGEILAAALCEVAQWQQGDYQAGRYIRKNNDATAFISDGVMKFTWKVHELQSGEGVYACSNYGSCVAPDVCSCPDGYTGFDCSKPICRHRQRTGKIVGCQNRGVCVEKDSCRCLSFESVLHKMSNKFAIERTGFTGSDCSIPICLQGFFDNNCPESDGGEGCYRCPNHGNCIAPDVCECSSEWTGYDCKTPICKISASDDLINQLQTLYPEVVDSFEKDPCLAHLQQGECTAPGICTCTCLDRPRQLRSGRYESGPWIDTFNRKLPPDNVYGTTECKRGWEGLRDEKGNFITCHLEIYEPTWLEYYTKTTIAIAALICCCCCWGYFESSRKEYQARLLRRARRKRRVVENDIHIKKRRRRQRKGNTERKKRYNLKST